MKGILRAAALTLALTLAFNCGAWADNNYVYIDKEDLPVYAKVNEEGVPVYGKDYSVGQNQSLKLNIDVPLSEIDEGVYYEGLSKIVYLRLTIENGRWRNIKERSYFNTVVESRKEDLKWGYTLIYPERPVTSINKVSYNADYYENVQYIIARIDGHSSYIENIDNLCGELPLIFKTSSKGEVKVTVDYYIGEDFFDVSKYTEEDYETLSAVTVAVVGSSAASEKESEAVDYEAAVAAETEQATEQTTSSIKTSVEIPIGQPYYTVNGERTAMDSPALIENGYTMLPLRAVSGVMGIDDSSISYYSDTKTAVINHNGRVIKATAGERVIYVDDKPVITDTAAIILNNRIYLPMRAVAKALDIEDISFDSSNKVVKIVL